MTYATENLSNRARLGSSEGIGHHSTHSFTIKDLNYGYKGQQVFKDFNLSSSAQIIILRGPSGCGKTTLLKLLSGNLKADSCASMPDQHGSCLILQEDSLLPWLTGSDNICKFIGKSPSVLKLHPMFSLIAGFVDRKVHSMSYGQRRLVELFRAIAHRPQYLYLDEPFNFLDEQNMGKVVPFLQEIAVTGTTIVLSNHHQEDLSMISCADVFKFDGKFPVQSILHVGAKL